MSHGPIAILGMQQAGDLAPSRCSPHHPANHVTGAIIDHGWGRYSHWQQPSFNGGNLGNQLGPQPRHIGGDSGREPYRVTHNQLLAHAAAVKLYKQNYKATQQGKIGITLVTNWMVPLSESKKDRDATQRGLDFMFGWFMDPLTTGDYPHSMRSLVGSRLPQFSDEQSKMLKGSFDFLGLNYYTARYVVDAPNSTKENPSYITDPQIEFRTERNGVPIGPNNDSSWIYVYPRGIWDLLLYTKRKYNDPLIYITENGVDEKNNSNLSVLQACADIKRIEYYYQHLSFVQKAIRDGVNVKGYFAWSLLDNFEWSQGYTVRFGINYINYKDGLKRHPKLSAIWFKILLTKF